MSKRPNDIKAPDGFLIGGERAVRPGGVVLFQRGWWHAPELEDCVGEYVWVHEEWTYGGYDERLVLKVAPPGYRSYFRAAVEGKTFIAERTSRPDAKNVWRNPVHKAWAERQS